MESLIIILLLVLLIGIVIYYKISVSSTSPDMNQILDLQKEIQHLKEKSQLNTPPNIPVNDIIKDRDYRAVFDRLYPAERRSPEYMYGNLAFRDLSSVFNYPTRGYPDRYQYMGNLIRNKDEKIVQLYGRQNYPGSNQYEYYGISRDDTGMEYKIPLPKLTKELNDGDQVNIDMYGTNGNFTLYLNSLDELKYNPWIL